MKRVWVLVAAMWVAHGGLGFVARAETVDQPAQPEIETFTQGELDVLLGPIALYPDPLIAVLLPAATQPSEIVLAARFWDRGGDVNDIGEQRWSESVKALAHYPEVVRWMDENLDWTRQLGEAFLNQPEEVMATIQRLRAMAHALGNLQSTPQQTVEVNEGEIDILPADPDFVYLPVYEPEPVYTRAGVRVWFGQALRTGGWWKHDWDWQNRRVVVWTKDCPRPQNWWRLTRTERFATQHKYQEWCPKSRAGQFPCKFWATRWQQNAKAHGQGGGGHARSGGGASVQGHSTGRGATVTRISAK